MKFVRIELNSVLLSLPTTKDKRREFVYSCILFGGLAIPLNKKTVIVSLILAVSRLQLPPQSQGLLLFSCYL